MLSAKIPSLLYVRFTPPIHRISLWVALVIAVIITQQSLTVSNAQGSAPYLDKVVHLLAYGLLGLFALPALPGIRPLWVIVGLGLFGGIIECGQGVMELVV